MRQASALSKGQHHMLLRLDRPPQPHIRPSRLQVHDDIEQRRAPALPLDLLPTNRTRIVLLVLEHFEKTLARRTPIHLPGELLYPFNPKLRVRQPIRILARLRMLTQVMIRVENLPLLVLLALLTFNRTPLHAHPSRLSVCDKHVTRARYAISLQLLHGFVTTPTLQHHSQTQMTRDFRRIHPLDLDGVQAHSDTRFIQADLTDNPRLGHHLDGRDVRVVGLVRDTEEDEIGLLRFHPVPVLRKPGCGVSFPGQRGAAVGEEAEGDFGADVAGEDVW